MAFFQQKVYENSTNEWATPKSFIRDLGESIGGFDLDPASGAEDHGLIPNKYTKDDNGLAQEWFGKVFLNPPFSNKVKWIRKAVKETNRNRAETVFMLLPVDTSASWFHNLVTQAKLICFIGPGRMDFDRRSEPGDKGSPSFAVMIVLFGEIPNRKELFSFLRERGTIFEGGKLKQDIKQSSLSKQNGQTEDKA